MAIGYACILLGVYNTILHRTLAKNADDTKLRELTKRNLEVLEKMIDYNINNHLMLFRISSDIIPFASHPLNQQKWWEEHRERFEMIGQKIAKSGMRVSMHPGQYTLLNSPKEEVVKNAVKDLIYHERFLTALGTEASHKLILHVGGVYGDKKTSTLRFIENYKKLPDEVKARLVIENDEKSYAVHEVHSISEKTGIPVVFDVLHHQINQPDSDLNIKEWIKLCNKSWKNKDGRPKIHYSQQAVGERTGAHSKTINVSEFLDFYSEVEDLDVDVMLEVKDKNLSALKCSYSLHPEQVKKKHLEQEWARYKYLVLSRSARLYMEMRPLMKKEPAEAVRIFYRLVEESEDLAFDRGAQQNAALHVWGYFKDKCTSSESKTFFYRLEKFMDEETELKAVKNYLWRMAEKYKEEYLLNSYYFL